VTGQNSQWEINTTYPGQTEALGKSLAKRLKAGDVVALYGDLGAGKTCLVRGLAQALGTAEDTVTSPTFTLLNEYQGRIPLYHFDLYRLHTPQELEDLGCDDYFYGDGICILEWAEKAGVLLPHCHWKVYFTILDGDKRLIRIISPDYEEKQ